MSEYFKLLHEEKSYLQALKEATEPKVKIPVKHPGVLEVPEGKNVEDLPYSHFKALASKKGFGKISKALNNLHVWNRERDPKLAGWADRMQAKLSKEFSETATEAEKVDKEKDEVEELDIHQPDRGTRGGFGSIGGKDTRGGFGSIAGRPRGGTSESEELEEKWAKDVKVQSTGQHAGKSIEQLKKEINALKGKPGNKEKMGELLFALRAKQGWRKKTGL